MVQQLKKWYLIIDVSIFMILFFAWVKGTVVITIYAASTYLYMLLIINAIMMTADFCYAAYKANRVR